MPTLWLWSRADRASGLGGGATSCQWSRASSGPRRANEQVAPAEGDHNAKRHMALAADLYGPSRGFDGRSSAALPVLFRACTTDYRDITREGLVRD